MFGKTDYSGDFAFKVNRAKRIGLDYKIKNLPNIWRGYWRYQLAKLCKIPTFYATLELQVIKASGEVVHYGVVATRVVTTAFVNDIVDTLQAVGTTFDDYKYHDYGTGTTAEAIGDTGLVTPFGGSRVSGTQAEPSANVYRSVATVPFTSTLAITEHGLFNASSSGVLMDRSVFSAVNVVNGDSISGTYSLTCTAGG